jgi:hypothetical protein
VQRQPYGRRQSRLQPPRLAGAQPLDRQPEPRPEAGQALERLGLVVVACDHERADLEVAGVVQRSHEVRVPARALQAELEQRLLAELRLGHRREHPRGDVPRARLAHVHDDDAGAAALRLTRAGEADRAAADDGDVVAL